MKKVHESHPIDVAIWRISHHHRHLVHTRLESLGLYRGQHRMLSALGELDGQAHSELAEKLRISNATVSKMVQRMEQNGFVERHTDQYDQRISRVFLTDKGKTIFEQMKQTFRQLQEDEIEGFNEEEIPQLMEYLDRLNQNMIKHIPHHQVHKTSKPKKSEEKE